MVTVAIPWNDLKKYDMTIVDKYLGRSEKIDKAYSLLSKEEKINTIVEIKEKLKLCQIWLRENEYPYNVESNIKHYVLWTLEEKDLESSKQYASSLLGKNKSDIIIFTNHTSVKSIHEINHHHVFVKI